MQPPTQNPNSGDPSGYRVFVCCRYGLVGPVPNNNVFRGGRKEALRYKSHRTATGVSVTDRSLSEYVI